MVLTLFFVIFALCLPPPGPGDRNEVPLREIF